MKLQSGSALRRQNQAMTAPSPLLLPDHPDFWRNMGLWMTGDDRLSPQEEAERLAIVEAQVARMERAA